MKPFSAFLISQAPPMSERHILGPLSPPTQELAMGFSEWEGICLPMQEAGVQSLTWEDPTHAAEQLRPCSTTAEPVLQSPGATTSKPTTRAKPEQQ